jgi:Tol biopolymer transport system component
MTRPDKNALRNLLRQKRRLLYGVTLVLAFACVVVFQGNPPSLRRKWLVGGGRYDRYKGGGRFLGAGLSISPDGKSIAYATPRTGKGDIYLLQVATGYSVRLSTDANYEGYPQFSPDGKKIAFVREDNNRGCIWLMNVDGSQQQALTSGDADDCCPVFFPDNQSILFGRSKPGSRVHGLFRVSSSGSTAGRNSVDPFPIDAVPGEIAVAARPASDTLPQLLYCTSGPPPGIWQVSTDGTRRTYLGEGQAPALSPDGKTLVFLGGEYRDSVWLMGVDGTKRRMIYQSANREYLSCPSYLPDGKNIVFLKERGARGVGEVTVIGVDGRNLRTIASTK